MVIAIKKIPFFRKKKGKGKGNTIATLQRLGKTPFSKEMLMILDSGSEIKSTIE